jgi:hypothetical protein
VIVSPTKNPNKIGLPTYTTKRMIDVMLAATQATIQKKINKKKPVNSKVYVV